MFCHKCGTQLPESSGFCHKCGTKMVRGDNTQQPPVMSEPTSVVPMPQPVATPQMQSNPVSLDNRQRSVIGLCKAIFALRLVDAIGWTLMVILQIAGGIDFWSIVWNIVCTILCYVYAIRLFGVISSNGFDSVRILGVVGANLKLAAIGGIFYGVQFFYGEIPLMFLFIVLELVVLVVGAIAYFTARRMTSTPIQKEFVPAKETVSAKENTTSIQHEAIRLPSDSDRNHQRDEAEILRDERLREFYHHKRQLKKGTISTKDMNVSLQNDETEILKDKCHRVLDYYKKSVSYSGIGTLTNKRFIFASDSSNTQEWAIATYGDNAPFHLMNDIIILLSDIAKLDELPSSTPSAITIFRIRIKAGMLYKFILSSELRDALKYAITEKEMISVQDVD